MHKRITVKVDPSFPAHPVQITAWFGKGDFGKVSNSLTYVVVKQDNTAAVFF